MTSAKSIILIDTIPNKEIFRNKEIECYNAVLTDIANKYPQCHKLDIYKDFLQNMDNYYLDDTHMNDKGYNFVAKRLLHLYESVTGMEQ
jgi:lysophospholipase L1-like esterase